MSARITIQIVYSSNFWLNMKTMSPRAIIVGGELDYAKHCRLEFGTYCQVHEEHDNSMATRAAGAGAIALRPTGNTQGGYYFFSLTTGRRLNRNRWTELPMPADIIDRVYTLARRGLAVEGLSFADRNGHDPNDGDPNDNDDDKSDDDDDSWNPGDDDNDTTDDAGDDNNDGDASLQEDTTAGVNDDDNVAHENYNENYNENFVENNFTKNEK
jgi:hypothetical protein